jgi:hypothetical protein
MKFTKIMSFLAGISACALVHASPVTWDLNGHVNNSFNGPAVGTQIEVFLTFDPAANLQNISPAGRYIYNPSSIQMAVWVGGFYGNTFFYDPTAGASLFVRNDSLVGGVPVDGVTMALAEWDEGNLLQLIALFRGTDTSVLSSGAIPVDFPAGLLTEEMHTFQACESTPNNPNSCDVFQVDVVLDSVSKVPEPATLALFGLGAAALARTRRRPC